MADLWKREKSASVVNGSPNRRNHPRSQIRLLTVYKLLGKNGKASSPEIGYTRDISAGGMYFYTSRRADEGNRISLTIHFGGDFEGGSNPPKLDGEGTVARVEKNCNAFSQADVNGMAVHFASDLTISVS